MGKYAVTLIVESMADWTKVEGSTIINMIGDRCLSNEDIEFGGVKKLEEGPVKEAPKA